MIIHRRLIVRAARDDRRQRSRLCPATDGCATIEGRGGTLSASVMGRIDRMGARRRGLL
jgi:hypothetical protein